MHENNKSKSQLSQGKWTQGLSSRLHFSLKLDSNSR